MLLAALVFIIILREFVLHFWRLSHILKLLQLCTCVRCRENRVLIGSSHMSTCRGRYNNNERVVPYNSQTVHRTIKNLTSTRSGNWDESRGIGHAHLRLDRFRAKWQKLQNLLFRTRPRLLVRSAWNLVYIIYRCWRQKVIKRILIRQSVSILQSITFYIHMYIFINVPYLINTMTYRPEIWTIGLRYHCELSQSSALH